MSSRKQEDSRLLDILMDCFYESQRTYGVRRLTDDLNDLGETVNHKRVARIKQENKLYPKQHKAYVATTDSTHGKAVADNLLNRQFDVSKQNEVWVSDITYLHTHAGWVYLAVIIDLYSRMVIGWQLAEHMRAELVSQAVDMARTRRGRLPKLFHSDHGSQYVSDEMETALEGVTLSMSRKGNCWECAACPWV